MSYKYSLPFGSSDQNFVLFLISPMRATCTVLLILLDLITLIVFTPTFTRSSNRKLLVFSETAHCTEDTHFFWP